jgi:acyl-CoA synthetase (AMP-forming)/AMP-acid ligase II
VYPSEIENVLHAHPAIAEAAVLGVPDERLGEEVMAVVSLRAGLRLTASELTAYCQGQMAAYKYPRIIEFRDQLPKNSLGKVLKDELARSWLSGGRRGTTERARRLLVAGPARPGQRTGPRSPPADLQLSTAA